MCLLRLSETGLWYKMEYSQQNKYEMQEDECNNESIYS